ncbi:MAG: hypothetical protein KGJ07_08790 [Patescibacteria group bacterium]|nr:hypothetical protein [Patescibacteria group bacterium]
MTQPPNYQYSALLPSFQQGNVRLNSKTGLVSPVNRYYVPGLPPPIDPLNGLGIPFKYDEAQHIRNLMKVVDDHEAYQARARGIGLATGVGDFQLVGTNYP